MRRASSVGAGISLAAAAALDPGCATVESTDWAGHEIAEVVKQLGPPKATIPGGGLTVSAWDRETEVVQSLRTTINPDGGFETPAYCKRWILLVDREGTITEVRIDNLPWWYATEPAAK